MTTTQANRRGLRRVLDAVPLDLVLVVAFALVVDALVIASVGWTPLRFLLGAAFLFFVPGYVLVATLFPGRPRRTVEGRHLRPTLRDPHEGLVLAERLAVSFGASVALIPVVAVVLGSFSWTLTTESVMGATTVLVLVLAVIGALRRARLRPADRFAPFGSRPTRGDGGERATGPSRRSTALAVGLVLAVGLAGGLFVYGIAAEPPSTNYTNAMLVTESDDGSHVASGYPTNGTAGEPLTLTLRVDNHRDRPANVTAVVVLERPEPAGDVTERDHLTTLTNRIPAGDRWNATHEVTPTYAGADLRLTYYVYDGEVPSTVGPETADQELYLRIDVEPGAQD